MNVFWFFVLIWVIDYTIQIRKHFFDSEPFKSIRIGLIKSPKMGLRQRRRMVIIHFIISIPCLYLFYLVGN